MALTIFTVYAALALVAAAGVYVLSGKAADERRPASNRVPLSLLAGLMWPLLFIGLVEFTSVAAYAKVHEGDDAEPGVAVLA